MGSPMNHGHSHSSGGGGGGGHGHQHGGHGHGHGGGGNEVLFKWAQRFMVSYGVGLLPCCWYTVTYICVGTDVIDTPRFVFLFLMTVLVG